MRYAWSSCAFSLITCVYLGGCKPETKSTDSNEPTTKPVAASQPSTRPTLRYTANRDRSEGATHVPFWVPPKGAATQVYRDPVLFGLEIQSLNVDGALVAAQEDVVRFSKFPDASSLSLEQGSMYIYQVPVRVNSSGAATLEVYDLRFDGFRLRSFTFPANANSVVIRYRVRYANGKEFGSEMSEVIELELRHVPLPPVNTP